VERTRCARRSPRRSRYGRVGDKMAKFRKVDVSEQQLGDLVRQRADAIEDALVYVDRQNSTAGDLDWRR
jgi:hypothetical protein